MGAYDLHTPEELKIISDNAFREKKARLVIAVLEKPFSVDANPPPTQFPLYPALEKVPGTLSHLIVGRLDSGNMAVQAGPAFNEQVINGERLVNRVLHLSMTSDPDSYGLRDPNARVIGGDAYLMTLMPEDPDTILAANISYGALLTARAKVENGSHQRILFGYKSNGPTSINGSAYASLDVDPYLASLPMEDLSPIDVPVTDVYNH